MVAFHKALSAATVALALSVGIAMAHPVFDRATVPTIGCNNKQDLLAAKWMPGMAPGKCFLINPGQIALTAPEWQDNGTDIWMNVGVFKTKSGRRFYSYASTWRYIGDATSPDFVQ